MRRTSTRLFMTMLLMLVSVTSFAYDVEVDGIYYNLISKAKTAEVTYATTDYNSYSGTVAIPETITVDDITYSVTSIEKSAFYDCTDLTSVTIGNSVTSIGTMAFFRNNKIENVYCYAVSVPTTGEDAFKDANIASTTLHVPAASVDLYKAVNQWKDFGNIVALTEDDPKPTAINSITSDSQPATTTYYDLSGRKSNSLQKGLNIVNGKKVIR